MHDLFSDWYGKIDLEPNPDLLTRRWACVEAAVKQLTPELALELIRNFLDVTGPPTSGEPSDVTRIFKAADKSFPMTGNARLVRVLSGAALAQAFAKRNRYALHAALATITASCQAAGDPPLPGIVEQARAFATSMGAQARIDALVESKNPHLDVPDNDVATAVPTLQDVGTNQWNVITSNFQQLTPWLQQTDSTVRELIAAITRIAAELNAIGALARGSDQDRVAALREECEILWWLFGGATPDGKPFSSLSQPRGAIVHALELASRTRLSGPVPAASAFLAKALGPLKRGDQLALSELLDNAGVDACGDAAKAYGSIVVHTWAVTPVLLGISKGAELRNPKAWVENCGLGGALSNDFKLSALEWSLQLYYECLLSKAWGAHNNA